MAERLVEVTSTVEGVVSAVLRAPGDEVASGTPIVVAELMKLERPVVAADAGVLVEVVVAVGDEIVDGTVVARLDPDGVVDGVADGDTSGSRADGSAARGGQVDDRDANGGDAPSVTDRPDLQSLRDRRRLVTDEARDEAVARRRETGSRTARENVADLVDPGSWTEYGALAHAAQRQRRDADELRRRTPADGIITGIGTIGSGDDLPAVSDHGSGPTAVAVAAYDYTVLAGTQGHTSHAKLDRILGVAHRLALPFVLYAEGGGGRPGDTDVQQGAWLGVPTFRLLAQLAGAAPTVAVCHGYSFAGNAALAGVCDVVVATGDAVIGMAGPAMVAGGGLGDHEPEELGPVADHVATGAVDVVVEDEQEATAVTRRVVGLLRQDRVAPVPDARREVEVGEALRHLVPLDHKRAHDAGELLRLVVDQDSLVELRAEARTGIRTALARIGGHAVGVLANDPDRLAGAIDSVGAESAAQLLELCDRRGLPVVSLVDTPGFMVGPEADAAGSFRRTGRLYLAGSRLRTPVVAVVVRRAFGLGAMAMVGGDLQAPLATFAWPSAELGPMGLEGAVRLGVRRELDAIDDEQQREERVAELLAEMRERAGALNIATFAEIDDVIDPAETRARITTVLDAARGGRGADRV